MTAAAIVKNVDMKMLTSEQCRLLKQEMILAINKVIDSVAEMKVLPKKKNSPKKAEVKIPIEMIYPPFRERHCIGSNFANGITMSWITSMINVTYFVDGFLEKKEENYLSLGLRPYELEILKEIKETNDPFNIQSGDIKILSRRIKITPTTFKWNGVEYDINNVIALIDKLLANEVMNEFDQTFLFSSLDFANFLKDLYGKKLAIKGVNNTISRSRLLEYFERVLSEGPQIYTLIEKTDILEALEVPCVNIGNDMFYTKVTTLTNKLESLLTPEKTFEPEVFKLFASLPGLKNEKINIPHICKLLSFKKH